MSQREMVTTEKWGRRERRGREAVVMFVVSVVGEASYMDRVMVRWKGPLEDTRLLVASLYASIFVTRYRYTIGFQVRVITNCTQGHSTQSGKGLEGNRNSGPMMWN